MRIDFDAADPNELSAVFVAILVLRGGDISIPDIGDDIQVRGDTGLARTVPAPPAPVPQPPAAAVPLPPVVPASAPTPPVPPPPARTVVSTDGVKVDADGLPWDKRIHASPATIKKDGKWRSKRSLDEATRVAVTAELRQAMAAPAAGAPPPPAAVVPVAQGGAPAVGLDAALAQARAHLPNGEVPPPPPLAGEDAATVFGAGGAAAASEPPPPAPVDPLAAATADGWQPHPQSDGHYYRGQEVVATADLTARYANPMPPAPPAEAPAATGVTFADLMRKITGLQTAGTLTVERTTEIAQSLGITGVRDLMVRPDLIPSFDALLPVTA